MRDTVDILRDLTRPDSPLTRHRGPVRSTTPAQRHLWSRGRTYQDASPGMPDRSLRAPAKKRAFQARSQAFRPIR